MDAKQLHDHFIHPSLMTLGENFNRPNARFLLLLTCSVESDMGNFVVQKKSKVAKGIFQMEPRTLKSLIKNAAALQKTTIRKAVNKMMLIDTALEDQLVWSPMFACAMARIQYSTFTQPIPELKGNLEEDYYNMWPTYKEQYNSLKGATTLEAFIKKAKFYDVNYEMLNI